MTRQARSGGWGRRSIGRRQFLRESAATAAAMSSLGVLLAACGNDGSSRTISAIEVAGPENPVTLDLFDDNPAVESGLEPEAGPLKLFNWSEYIWPRVVKDFQEEYGVEVEITTFYNMSEAISKLRAGGLDFDVFFPTIDVVPKLVAAKLLQPLNRDYLPNLDANVWPELTNPFYDRKSQYTVPYTVYTTGIGYSTDLVSEDLGALENPYDVLWDSNYAGKVGIYDDYREAMSMVILRNGHTDINSGNPEILEETKNDLLSLSDAVRVKGHHRRRLRWHPRGQVRAPSGVVRRHGCRSLLPAERRRPGVASLLGTTGWKGIGWKRSNGDPEVRVESGACPPLLELHARQRRCDQELQLGRLPASAHCHGSG
jgi:spermidine/putrescine transport system substrate-binding protein